MVPFWVLSFRFDWTSFHPRETGIMTQRKKREREERGERAVKGKKRRRRLLRQIFLDPKSPMNAIIRLARLKGWYQGRGTMRRERPIDGQTNRQTDKQEDRKTARQTNRKTERQTDWQTGNHVRVDITSRQILDTIWRVKNRESEGRDNDMQRWSTITQNHMTEKGENSLDPRYESSLDWCVLPTLVVLDFVTVWYVNDEVMSTCLIL